MNIATKKMEAKPRSRLDLSKKKLDFDPDDEVYDKPGFTQVFAQARAVAAGNSAAPSRPPLEPPAGGFERWLEQASRWMIYVLSPENNVVQELIDRREQYLKNMTNSKKTLTKQHEALELFNNVNRQLRDKFLLPPRISLNFENAIKNNDDVADFLRANNLMK